MNELSKSDESIKSKCNFKLVSNIRNRIIIEKYLVQSKINYEALQSNIFYFIVSAYEDRKSEF